MSVETEDAFQKELVEVFVQEAQEWLQQIHVALDELQQAPPPDRHKVLADTIKAGIANLGGSAATINLSDVERASFAALPFVEVVQDPSAHIAVDDFVALCKQLGHIHTALTRATGVTFEAEGESHTIEQPTTSIATSDYLGKLQGIQKTHVTSGTYRRNIAQAMVAQAEGLIQRGIEQCDLNSVREFLDRSAEADQGFLQVLQQHVPHLIQGLRALSDNGSGSAQFPMALHTTVDRAAQLWSAAQQVNAPHAMMFFMGLHSFLTIATQGKVVIATERYERVCLRLSQSTTAIEEWVESGRSERVAIQHVLAL